MHNVSELSEALNPIKQRVMREFLKLLKNKDYCDISVSELTKAAKVGRTSFYRIFNRKLDVLMACHEQLFSQLFASKNTAEDWLAKEPAANVVEMLRFFNSNSAFRRSMAYQLGSDMALANRLLRQQLEVFISERLQQCFGERLQIPASILGCAIGGLYFNLFTMGVMGSALDNELNSPERQAGYLQQLTSAQIKAALAES
ncbi:TetR/AcrR family transcriptional regulator [Shewanella avicenniae]|uniref:TetR/AcrR family transcriptional regulator n=1 Tax=Shewanella avicenniae TaxID=2814294 RepID=A0ABX7QPK6_9GAMM|nr:TetR/AcrR family transcriptional regulator [Shewanella avicenniae]QSX33402.1 TetR/AcrR family transcriptional regulator [Shewanella avicenniae]